MDEFIKIVVDLNKSLVTGDNNYIDFAVFTYSTYNDSHIISWNGLVLFDSENTEVEYIVDNKVVREIVIKAVRTAMHDICGNMALVISTLRRLT